MRVAIALVACFACMCAIVMPVSHTVSAVDPDVLRRLQDRRARVAARRAACRGEPMAVLPCVIAAEDTP